MALKFGPADVSSVRLTVMVVPTATLVALFAGLVSLTAGRGDVRRPETEAVRVTETPAAFLMESAGMRDRVRSVVAEVRCRVDRKHVRRLC